MTNNKELYPGLTGKIKYKRDGSLCESCQHEGELCNVSKKSDGEGYVYDCRGYEISDAALMARMKRDEINAKK